MNHVLQYTQLKFKFDLIMKLEILGSIPNGVTNLWTLTRSTNWHNLRIKTNDVEKKSGFRVLENPFQRGTIFVWSRHLLFILFLK